jgi:hypothetical protein
VVLRDTKDQTPLSENWRGNRTPNHPFLSRGSITARLVMGCLMFTLIRTGVVGTSVGSEYPAGHEWGQNVGGVLAVVLNQR